MVSDRLYKRMQMGCICGHVSRSPIEEARHRHNFPAYCKRKSHRCGSTRGDGKPCRRHTYDKHCWQHTE